MVEKTRKNRKNKILKVIIGVVISIVSVSIISHILFHSLRKYEQVDTFQFEKIYSKEQLTQDTNLLFEKIESIHPGITVERADQFTNNSFDLVTNEHFIQIHSSAVDNIDQDMSGREYVKYILPSITILNDEHTEIDFFEFEDMQNQKFFPLDIKIDFIHGECIVESEYQNIPKNSVITEINGEPVSDILQHITTYFSGVSVAQKENYVRQYYKEALYIYFGNVDYEITLKDGESFLLEPIQYSSSEKVPYSYQIENDTVFFTYQEFIDPDEEFEDFLNEMFFTIKEKDIQNLVIDLSDNRGGDSYYGDMILYYLTDEEFTQISSSAVKASKDSKDFFLSYIPAFTRWAFPQYYIPPLSQLFSVRDGEFATIDINKSSKSMHNKFQGNVEVRVNPGTMSSASLLAATIEEYHLGHITGINGGGYASHFGNQLRVYMDNSGLPVFIPCSYNYGNTSGSLIQ